MQFAVGKQTRKTCKQLIEQLPGCFVPLPDSVKATFYSDGNDDYTIVLPEFFPKLEYGQLIKIRKGGRVVGKIKKVIYGQLSEDEIETTDIENFNGIMRERIGRLVRQTKCHSKLKTRLVFAVDLFRFHWDFMDSLEERGTPAMLEGLTDDAISWHDFFYWFVKYP